MSPALYPSACPLSRTHSFVVALQPPLVQLIQNGFTGEAKAGEARKTGFSRLLVHFNPGLQNGFTLQCLDLRKIDEAEAGISRAKEALMMSISNRILSDMVDTIRIRIRIRFHHYP